MLKKPSLLLVFLLSFSLLLAGCGQDNATAPNDQNKQEAEQQSLLVYCGAGLKAAADDIAQVFEEKNNVTIEYHYANAAQSLTQMELSQEGDLYIPGSLSYGETANEKGFVSSMENVCYHIPVIGLPEGNPAGITKLEDLARPGVKVVLGDPEGPAIGKTSAKILKNAGLWEAVNQNLVSNAATVNEIATYLTMKQCDAAIIWEDNAKGVEGIEVIQIPDEQNDIKTVPVCVLKFSKKPELAQQFADFILSSEGKAIFAKHGFKPVE